MKQRTREELARIIAVDGEKLSALQFELSSVKADAIHAEGSLQAGASMFNTEFDTPKKRRDEIAAAKKVRVDHLEALKMRRAALEPQVEKLEPIVEKAHKELTELNAREEAERRVRVAGIVEAAAKVAPSRQPLHEARTKLTGLQVQLTQTERELRLAETVAPQDLASPERRAEALLESGVMPPVGTAARSGEILKRLDDTHRTLVAAVKMQQTIVEDLASRYSTEIAHAIRPAVDTIVKRISDGVDAARQATIEARLLRVALNVAGGQSDVLPSFTYAGIRPPYGVQDGFDFWRDAMRRAGHTL